MDTQPKSCIIAPKANSHSAVFPRAKRCTPGALGQPPSARPTPGDTDTPPQAATRATSSLAHPGPSPTLASVNGRSFMDGTRPVCPQQLLELWILHKLGRYPGREGKPRAPGFLSLHNFRWRPVREQRFLQHFLPSQQLGADLLTLLLPKAGSCAHTQQMGRGLQWGCGTGWEHEQDLGIRAPLSASHHPALGPHQGGHQSHLVPAPRGATQDPCSEVSQSCSILTLQVHHTQEGSSPQGSDPSCSIPAQLGKHMKPSWLHPWNKL